MRSKLAPVSVAWLAALILMLVIPFANAQEDAVELKIKTLSSQLTPENMQKYWNAVQGMQRLGKEAVPVINKLMDEADDDWVIVGYANALWLLQEYEVAGGKLLEIVEDSLEDDARLLAIDTLGNMASVVSSGTATKMKSAFESATEEGDPLIQIHSTVALWRITNDGALKDKLKRYLESEDVNVRYAAALKLTEMMETKVNRPILEEMSKEPSTRGQLAQKALLMAKLLDRLEGGETSPAQKLIDDLQKQISKLQSDLTDAKNENNDLRHQINQGVTSSSPFSLLDEIALIIQKKYVDGGERIRFENLVTQAAKGLVHALDPHSTYYTAEDLKAFDEGLNQHYGGIGAYVEQRPTTGAIIITRPIFGGPAWKLGLQAGDILTSVHGKSIMDMSLDDVIKLLKGEEGTDVTFGIYRASWGEEREFTCKRARIQIPDIVSEMLPGNIGYIQQTTFGVDENPITGTSDRLRAAFKDLKDRGAKALIYDLRDNSGGDLTQAIRTAGVFLPKGSEVIALRGRNDDAFEPQIKITDTDPVDAEMPVVVLVNGQSASASEAVSGALRDHKRAVLVGEKTFGKGSMQKIWPLTSKNGETALRLTVAKYYLPGGETPHEVGITPEHVVEPRLWDMWVYAELGRLRQQDVFVKYAEKIFNDDHALAERLAQFDAHDAAKYPGFDEWFKSLNTSLLQEHALDEIRFRIRRLLEGERKSAFPTDIQEDVQLQKAIQVTCEKLGMDPNTIEEYKQVLANR